jgi:hypothetical protein
LAFAQASSSVSRMDHIERGSEVVVRDVVGDLLPRRAISEVEMGHDFPVVWVCKDEEWAAAEAEGREPEGVPWPAEDVSLLSGATA